MNREDFEMLNKDIIFFDNNATTFKPKQVVNKVVEYYTKYTSNAHRGDYKTSLKVDLLYEETRNLVQEYINSENSNEIVFTSGTTDSLNMIAFGFFKEILNKDDEVLITKTEHASNVLPWLELEKDIGIKVKYAKLDENLKLTEENLKTSLTSKTKVVSIAHVTNTIGDVRDLEKIGKILKEKDIYFVVDAAQSAGHRKIDVQKMNIDFLAFSAHKMLGPTGVGVLYGKYKLLEIMRPVRVGGGMNSSFESDGSFEYHNPPTKFEAGTANIAGVIGFGEAIKYINNIGLVNIENHDNELKEYLLEKLSKVKNINILNKNAESANILFNIEGVFPQDTAIYLDHYNICVRAGNHCAKILKEELGIKNTVRISLYFYNDKTDIEKLINALKNPNLKKEII